MPKIKRESINFKLPKDLVEEVRAKAKELNTTATALVIEGLSVVLGINQDIGTDANLDANLDANKSSIVEVESRLQKHVDTLLDFHLSAILNRLSLLEKGQSQIRLQLGSNDSGLDTSIDNSLNPVGADSVDDYPHLFGVDNRLHSCSEGHQEECTDNGVEPPSKATPTVNLPVKEKQNRMDGDHRLVDTPYTQKQLASYLGVSVSTIKSHTKKGKEHFENWSKTQDRHNGLSWSFDGAEPTEYYAIHNTTSAYGGF